METFSYAINSGTVLIKVAQQLSIQIIYVDVVSLCTCDDACPSTITQHY